MTRVRVLVTDYAWPDLEVERRALGSGDVELVDGRRLGDGELRAAAVDAEAILTCWRPVTGALLEGARSCRVVSRYGIGLDNIDVDAASRLGIVVTNVPDYCVDEVADHTLALMLAAARRVGEHASAVRAGRWGIVEGPEPLRLRGRSMGLLGFGRIGQAVARRALAFGMEVRAHAPSLREKSPVRGVGICRSPLELAQGCGVLSLHAPLDDATRGLVDGELLARLAPGAILVNTARGEIVDESALVAALESGRLAAAALDVLGSEPPREGHPLRFLPNVIVTPHMAFRSAEALDELRRRAAAHVADALAGRAPACVVRPEVLESPHCRLR